MKAKKIDMEQQEIGNQTAAAQLFDAIRADIIRGDLAPGMKLVIADLADRYSAGVIPVREALSRLATGGFVEAKSQRGFSVKTVSPEELADITRVRLLVESAALEDSIEHGDTNWEERVLSALHRLSKLSPFSKDEPGKLDKEWESAHENFHSQLISACLSPSLLEIVGNLRDQATRYRHISLGTSSSAHRPVGDEHHAMGMAAIERRSQLAIALFAEHINTSTRSVLVEGRAMFGRGTPLTRKQSKKLPKAINASSDSVPGLKFSRSESAPLKDVSSNESYVAESEIS